MTTNPDRKSIQNLQSVIRQKRRELGLPPDGPVKGEELIEAMRQAPPVKELVNYIRSNLSEEETNPPPNRPEGPSSSRFDRRA